MDNWGGTWPENTFFANNIFYVSEKANFQFKKDEGTKFTNNCFFGKIGNLPNDPNAIFSDPKFLDVNATGEGFAILKNFMLTKGSPCVNAGIIIDEFQGEDLLGNKIEGLPEIGAIEIQ